jgi:hypothetical protein
LIDAICTDPPHKFAIDKSQQTISFNSGNLEDLSLFFRLAPELTHTHWKKNSPDDSVWMVEIADPPPPVLPQPGPTDWCGKIGDKHVVVSGSDMSFKMCKHMGAKHRYKYSVHLEQIGNDQIPVDIGIDPQIIHQP